MALSKIHTYMGFIKLIANLANLLTSVMAIKLVKPITLCTVHTEKSIAIKPGIHLFDLVAPVTFL